jgi:hypothetical protein
VTDRTAIFLVIVSFLLVVTIGMLSVACDPPEPIPKNYEEEDEE